MHLATISLVVFYDIRDFVKPLSEFLEQCNYKISYFPLYKLEKDPEHCVPNAVECLVKWIKNQQPDVMLWIYNCIPAVTFSRVIKRAFPNLVNFYYNPEFRTNDIEQIKLMDCVFMHRSLGHVPHSVQFSHVGLTDTQLYPELIYIVTGASVLMSHPICREYYPGVVVIPENCIINTLVFLPSTKGIVFMGVSKTTQEHLTTQISIKFKNAWICPSEQKSIAEVVSLITRRTDRSLLTQIDQHILYSITSSELRQSYPISFNCRLYFHTMMQLPRPNNHEAWFDQEMYVSLNGIDFDRDLPKSFYIAHWLWEGYRSGCIYTQKKQTFGQTDTRIISVHNGRFNWAEIQLMNRILGATLPTNKDIEELQQKPITSLLRSFLAIKQHVIDLSETRTPDHLDSSTQRTSP